MPLPTTFGTLVTPPGATGAEIDQCLNIAALLGVLPCTLAGTNALTLTLATTNPTVSAYANYLRFSAIAVSDNTGAVTALVGSLAALNVYRDGGNGPIALAGGEIQAGSLIILTYDSALNSGAGGFHLATGTSILKNSTINPNALVFGNSAGTLTASAATLTAMMTRTATVTFTVTPANAVNDTTATLSGLAANDSIIVTGGTLAASMGGGYQGFFAAAGTMTLRAMNPTASSLAATTVILQLTALRVG